MSDSPSTLRLDQIGQIAMPVRDVEKAIAFYRDVLGMRFLFKAPPGLGLLRLRRRAADVWTSRRARKRARTARSSTTRCRTSMTPSRRSRGVA
jgi:catechol-2,3-dioxygenase